MEKSRRWRNEDLWESSPQTSICSSGCFTALSHFHPHSAFSSTEIGFSAPFPYLYLPLSIAHTIFCISSVTKAIWKGFVVPVFHTVVLRISIKRAENQRGNKYFLLSLPHCYCIFHSYFTYSVNKEPCQALRLKKKKKLEKWLQCPLRAYSLEERHVQNGNKMPSCYNIKYILSTSAI